MIDVAALYVQTDGCYFGLPGVDPWDEPRDARQYTGPHPVVALWIKRTGERQTKGADNGCFKSALAAVRAFGGILEHPEGSHAWAHFGISKPPREGGWIVADFHGGWTCCVEQRPYGHYARKPTWLYAVGCDLPELAWGKSEVRLDPKVVERMGLARAKRLGEVGARGGGKDSSPRIGTPPEFRDLLLSIARSASQVGHSCIQGPPRRSRHSPSLTINSDRG